MRSIKKFFAITLLALVVGSGTPAAFADGSAESPGIHTSGTTEATVEGTSEAPGYFGAAESPGFVATIIIYLDVII